MIVNSNESERERERETDEGGEKKNIIFIKN